MVPLPPHLYFLFHHVLSFFLPPPTPPLQALLDRIADELSLLFAERHWRSRVKPQTISNLAWAYATLRRCPQKLMQVGWGGVGWGEA